MDHDAFDRLTQQFGRVLSRRRFGAVLAALGLGAGLGAETRAKPKKKKKKKPKGCKNGAVNCGSACVDTQTNAAHCGGCGRSCGAGQACAGGACQTGGCPGDRELCGAECVNLDNDELHCGECGRACGGDLTCLNGACGCASGTQCGTRCADLDDDDAHCGQCDRPCQGDLTCSNGRCGCASGTECGSACVNFQTNSNNCGGCGNACTGNQTCSGGVCVDPPECVDQYGCGGYEYNDLVCRNGRCVCANADEGLCQRYSDRRGSCDKCCPGGSGECRFDEICFYVQGPNGAVRVLRLPDRLAAVQLQPPPDRHLRARPEDRQPQMRPVLRGLQDRRNGRHLLRRVVHPRVRPGLLLLRAGPTVRTQLPAVQQRLDLLQHGPGHPAALHPERPRVCLLPKLSLEERRRRQRGPTNHGQRSLRRVDAAESRLGHRRPARRAAGRAPRGRCWQEEGQHASPRHP